MTSSISMASVIDIDTAVLEIPDRITIDDYGLKSTVAGKTIAPKTVIGIGSPYQYSKNGSTVKFTLKRFKDGYYICDCPAWRYSSERDKFRRSCIHLAEMLGDEYEHERIKVAREAPGSVWEISTYRKNPTPSTVASRQAKAKTLLAEHLKEASQRESQAVSADPDAPVASKSRSSSNKNNNNKKRPHADDDDDGSDTEVEEDVLPSPASRLNQADTGAALTPEVPGNDDTGSGPERVPSPSKKARGSRKGDDDKLLLGNPWPLHPDPKKPQVKPKDPTGWWMSEKLDGCRAFWDGQRLFSRQNLEWNAPAWWKDRDEIMSAFDRLPAKMTVLPKDITLDGELWMRRGTFDLTSQICRTTVRMGKIRTFKHFLKRDSMERAWLRDQLGGKLASQNRIQEEEACRHRRSSSMRSQSQSQHHHMEGQRYAALSDVTNLPSTPKPPANTGAGDDAADVTPSGKRASPWKSQKRSRQRLQSGKELQSGEISLLTLKTSQWQDIKFMVFDAPSMDGKVVEERWAELNRRFNSTEGIDIDTLQGHAIRLVHHERCRGREHLLARLEEIESKGGEGLMLREPVSMYEFGRSSTLYKLKSFYDAEAEVVGYQEGDGRHKGRMGTLVVQMENGLRVGIGTGFTDRQRENPPPVGTIISYRFQEIGKNGHPRFPSFRGVAHDKTSAKDAIVRPNAIVIRNDGL